MQNYYNPVYREEGIALIPWSALARGFLSGKYHRTESPESSRYRSDRWLSQRLFRLDFDVLERAEEIAKEKDVPVAQLALSWLLHKGMAAPIIGATKVEHVEDTVGAVELKLNDDDIKRLEEPYRPHIVMGTR